MSRQINKKPSKIEAKKASDLLQNASEKFWKLYNDNRALTVSGCVVAGTAILAGGHWIVEKINRKRLGYPDGPVGFPVIGMAYHRGKSKSGIEFAMELAKYDAPLVSYFIGYFIKIYTQKILLLLLLLLLCIDT